LQWNDLRRAPEVHPIYSKSHMQPSIALAEFVPRVDHRSIDAEGCGSS
jgi:hypothetical protein